MTTLGAVFRPQLAPEKLRSVARAADESGLEELWLWEDCFREGGISTGAGGSTRCLGPRGVSSKRSRSWSCRAVTADTAACKAGTDSSPRSRAAKGMW